MPYTSQYPPAFSSTYVKATSMSAFGAPKYPYPDRTTNPAKPLTGSYIDESGNYHEWLAAAVTNQRFHIDLGAAKIIRRIYYENMHIVGSYTNYGAKNFTFWGSNVASAFAALTYGTDTDWTPLEIGQSLFDRHVTGDVADPKYILVNNAVAFRYYAFKIANAYRTSVVDHGMGLRRIELQTEDGFVATSFVPRVIIM